MGYLHLIPYAVEIFWTEHKGVRFPWLKTTSASKS